VDVAASMGSANRPLRAAGTATVEGVPVALEVEVGSRGPSGRSLRLGAKLRSGRVDFDGKVSTLSSVDAVLAGRLTFEGADPPEFVDALVRLSGHEPVPLSKRVARHLGFKGDIEISPRRIVVERFKLSIADEAASGALTLTLGPAPALAGNLELSRIDADHWLKVAQDKAFLVPAPGDRLVVREGKARPPILSAVPEGASVKVAFLQGEQVVYVTRNGATLRKAVIALLAGPTASEQRREIASAVPARTPLRAVSVANGIATIDLGEKFAAGTNTAR